MDQHQQELMMKLSMFEQQIRQVQEQLQAVDQALGEAESLNIGLNELKEGKDKTIMAGIGKGIFAKATLTANDLLVDVGGNNFVKRSVSETQELIEEQMGKLEEAKGDLEQTLEKINEEMTQIFLDAQRQSKK